MLNIFGGFCAEPFESKLQTVIKVELFTLTTYCYLVHGSYLNIFSFPNKIFESNFFFWFSPITCIALVFFVCVSLVSFNLEWFLRLFHFCSWYFWRAVANYFAECPSFFGLSDICSGLDPGYTLSVDTAQKGWGILRASHEANVGLLVCPNWWSHLSFLSQSVCQVTAFPFAVTILRLLYIYLIAHHTYPNF